MYYTCTIIIVFCYGFFLFFFFFFLPRNLDHCTRLCIPFAHGPVSANDQDDDDDDVIFYYYYYTAGAKNLRKKKKIKLHARIYTYIFKPSALYRSPVFFSDARARGILLFFFIPVLFSCAYTRSLRTNKKAL